MKNIRELLEVRKFNRLLSEIVKLEINNNTKLVQIMKDELSQIPSSCRPTLTDYCTRYFRGNLEDVLGEFVKAIEESDLISIFTVLNNNIVQSYYYLFEDEELDKNEVNILKAAHCKHNDAYVSGTVHDLMNFYVFDELLSLQKEIHYFYSQKDYKSKKDFNKEYSDIFKTPNKEALAAIVCELCEALYNNDFAELAYIFDYDLDDYYTRDIMKEMQEYETDSTNDGGENNE